MATFGGPHSSLELDHPIRFKHPDSAIAVANGRTGDLSIATTSLPRHDATWRASATLCRWHAMPSACWRSGCCNAARSSAVPLLTSDITGFTTSQPARPDPSLELEMSSQCRGFHPGGSSRRCLSLFYLFLTAMQSQLAGANRAD